MKKTKKGGQEGLEFYLKEILKNPKDRLWGAGVKE